MKNLTELIRQKGQTILASDNFLDFETTYEGLNGKNDLSSYCYNLYSKTFSGLTINQVVVILTDLIDS